MRLRNLLRNLSNVIEIVSGRVDHHESESSDSGPDSALLLALCWSRKNKKKFQSKGKTEMQRNATSEPR